MLYIFPLYSTDFRLTTFSYWKWLWKFDDLHLLYNTATTIIDDWCVWMFPWLIRHNIIYPYPSSSSVFILSKYSEANVETRRVVVYSCFDKGEDPEIPFPYGNPSKTLRVNVECILPFYFVRREENVEQLQIVTGLYTTVRAIKEHREWERLRVGLRSALPRVGDWRSPCSRYWMSSTGGLNVYTTVDSVVIAAGPVPLSVE